jgi:hypothetical protein
MLLVEVVCRREQVRNSTGGWCNGGWQKFRHAAAAMARRWQLKASDGLVCVCTAVVRRLCTTQHQTSLQVLGCGSALEEEVVAAVVMLVVVVVV